MFLANYEQSLYAEFIEYRAYKWLCWIGNPTLLLVGSLGNCLLVWLLLRGPKCTAAQQYLVPLGLVDQLGLLSGLLNKWLQQMFGVNIETLCLATCLGNKFLSYFSSYLSAFLLSLVSIERALVVSFPLKTASLQSPRRARRLVVGVTMFSFLINCYWFGVLDLHSYSVLPDVNSTDEQPVLMPMCDIKESALLLSPIISVFDAVLYSVLPLAVIFACNLVTICKLHRARKRRQSSLTINDLGSRLRLTGGDTNKPGLDRSPLHRRQRSHSRSQENFGHVTILLLSITTFYLLASMPVTVLKVLTSLSGYVDLQALSKDASAYSRYRLVEGVTHLCMFSNHAANFFLYCASGQRVRAELLLRLRRLCCRLPANPQQHHQQQQQHLEDCNNPDGSQRRHSPAALVTYSRSPQQQRRASHVLQHQRSPLLLPVPPSAACV